MTEDAVGRHAHRVARTLAGGAFALAAASLPAHGQVGAIGAVPGGSASGAGALVGTPIFTNSALMLPKGRLGISGYGIYSTVSNTEYVFDVDGNVEASRARTTLFGSLGYGLSDQALIGVQLTPYASLSETLTVLDGPFQGEAIDTSTSGLGDAVLFAKYQVMRSANRATSVAAMANVSLPIGDYEKGFGSSGVAVGGGVAVSHQLGKVTLHGEGNVGFPLDDADGDPVFGVNGAGVFAVSPSVWLSGEVVSVISAGDFIALGAPGARFAVGPKAFVDVGLAFKLFASQSGVSWPTSVIVGFLMVP
jgi:hypothetical protein